jgi:hypothetical protein
MLCVDGMALGFVSPIVVIVGSCVVGLRECDMGEGEVLAALEWDGNGMAFFGELALQ